MSFSDFNREEHLTPQELVARWAGTACPVSLVTLARWRRLKQAPAYVKVGRGPGRVYYHLDTIKAYEDSIISTPTIN
jgi:hypothetical protein